MTTPEVRPRFGQPVTVKAIARRVRTKLGNDIAFKTTYQHESLLEPVPGFYANHKKGREGITDLYSKTFSFLSDDPPEDHYHFVPHGEAIELWLIALPGYKELVPCFPNDVEWEKPEADPGMEALL